MLRSGYLALAACALGAVLSGCGGSDKDGSPVASNMTLSTNEDTAIKVSLGSDPKGGTLTATLLTAPTKGDVAFSGGGSGSALLFTYTPHANDNGADFFTYQLSAGDKTSSQGRVVIGVNAVKDLPTFLPTLTTDEDTPVTAVLITDIEGDKFTSAVTIAPTHGTLTVDATDPGKFTYVPAADFNGTDSAELSATYTFPDTTTATVKGTVAITVRPVDDPPAGVSDSMRTVQGLAARFEPLANDSDREGDALAVTITAAPSVGTATVNADGSIQYTPTASFVGTTSLEYEVRDANGLTARATMSIEVGLTSGILYLSRADSFQPNELYFADGARSFKVNAALPAGDSIDSLKAATSAPIVFYRTQSGGLYRVDLRQPGVAQPVGQSVEQGLGIGEFAIDATGSKVAYAEGGAFKLVDFSAPDTVRDLSTDEYYALGMANSAAPKVLRVNAAASDSAQLLKRFDGAATIGPRANDGSFAVVIAAGDTHPAARDLHVVNLRDTAQIIDITSGMLVETPTLIPNF